MLVLELGICNPMGNKISGTSLIIKPVPVVSALHNGRRRSSRYRLSKKKKRG
jgi:hypothetical protein